MHRAAPDLSEGRTTAQASRFKSSLASLCSSAEALAATRANEYVEENHACSRSQVGMEYPCAPGRQSLNTLPYQDGSAAAQTCVPGSSAVSHPQDSAAQLQPTAVVFEQPSLPLPFTLNGSIIRSSLPALPIVTIAAAVPNDANLLLRM